MTRWQAPLSQARVGTESSACAPWPFWKTHLSVFRASPAPIPWCGSSSSLVPSLLSSNKVEEDPERRSREKALPFPAQACPDLQPEIPRCGQEPGSWAGAQSTD